MRKKLKMLFLTVMLLFLMGITVQAAVTEDGEFEYTGLEDGTVKITGYLGTKTEITIPEVIDNKTVTVLGYLGEKPFIKITGNSIIKMDGKISWEYAQYLKAISLPKVQTLTMDTFSGCTSLTSVYMPNLINIYENSFENCTSLESVSFPKVEEIFNDAFNNCKSLKSISIPKIKKIDIRAFNNCVELSQVTFSNHITEVGYGAFLNCFKLKEITIPHSEMPNPILGQVCLGYTYDGDFYEKIPGFKINCQKNSSWYKYAVNNGFITHTHSYTSSVTTRVTCTASGQRTYSCICGSNYIEYIPATGHAYSEYKMIRKPTCFENGILELKCDNCSHKIRAKLKKLKVPSKGSRLNDTKNKIIYKVTKAGLSGGTVSVVRYYGTSSSVTIPDKVSFDAVSYSITKLEANAFYNKDKIKKVTIGRNVSYIGSKCFYGCKKLKSLIIKTTKLTTKNVGSNSFKGIYSKAVVTIPAKKRSSYPKLFNTKGMPVTVKYKTSQNII